MPISLERVGWVDGQPVVAQDLIDLEDNVEEYIRTHVHGDGTHAAIPPQNIPAGSGAVGGVATVKQHLDNANIHFRLNQNLPIWHQGSTTTPPLSGSQPEYTTTITFASSFVNTDYIVMTEVVYESGAFVDIPDNVQIVVEKLSASSFRLHVRFVYTPYSGHPALTINWLAVGSSAAAI